MKMRDHLHLSHANEPHTMPWGCSCFCSGRAFEAIMGCLLVLAVAFRYLSWIALLYCWLADFYDLFTLLSQIRANIAEVPTFYCWTGEIFCNVDILLQSSMDVQITIYRSFCCLRNLFFACGGYCLKFSFFPKLFAGIANDEWNRLFTSHLHINCVPNLAKRLEWKYLKNVRKYTVSDLCITGNSSHSVAISLIEDKHLPVQSQFATLFRHSRDNPSK